MKIKVCVYIQGFIQDFLPGRGNTTAGGLEGYKSVIYSHNIFCEIPGGEIPDPPLYEPLECGSLVLGIGLVSSLTTRGSGGPAVRGIVSAPVSCS